MSIREPLSEEAAQDDAAASSGLPQHLARNKRVYTILRVCFGGILSRLTGFSYTPCTIENEPFLLLSNHTMDLDALFIVIGTKRYMRCVTSANVLDGFHGKLVAWLVDPIARRKGASADSAVMEIRENLAHGISVGLQASGQRSWDGGPSYISPRTVKLVRGLDCGLVTYRIEGGYFRTPRWAQHTRRGPTHGQLVHEYTHAELDAMTDEELYEAICADLRVDEYEVQRHNMRPYRGKRLAENLETACFLCPSCERMSTLKSKDDTIGCECGFAARYNEYGFLEPVEPSESVPRFFTTVLDWSNWQKGWLSEHRETLIAQTDSPFSVDHGVNLLKKAGKSWKPLAEDAEARIFGDRLEIKPLEADDTRDAEGFVFSWNDMSKVNPFRGRQVSFSCEGELYSIRRPEGISGFKYVILSRILKGLEWF